MRKAPSILLSENDRATLERWSRGRRTPLRLAQRAQIVLLAAGGVENQEIAVRLGVSKPTVGLWRRRFAELGIRGIEKDAPRGGRPPKERRDLVGEILRKTTQERPANATHWTTRSLARELGTNQSLIHRVWKANGLKPHLVRTFKLSRDPRFEEKLLDVVGLYLNPPEHALVLCADEKSQIQALDRTQPGLPLKRGRAGTMTHDYKRNGTTTLFAALNILDGTVIARMGSGAESTPPPSTRRPEFCVERRLGHLRWSISAWVGGRCRVRRLAGFEEILVRLWEEQNHARIRAS